MTLRRTLALLAFTVILATGCAAASGLWGWSVTVLSPVVAQSANNQGACALSNPTFLTTQPAANDLIIIYVLGSTTGVFGAPTGFTTLDTQTNSMHFAEYYKLASGSEGTSYTVTDTIANGFCTFWIVDVTNESTTNPFDQHSVNLSTLTGTTGPFTTNSLIPHNGLDLPITMLNTGSPGQNVVDETAAVNLGAGNSNQYFTNLLMYDTPTSVGPVVESMNVDTNNAFAHQVEVLDLISPYSYSTTPTPAPTPTPTPTPLPMPTAGTNFWVAGTNTWINANSGQCNSPVLSGTVFTWNLSYTNGTCYRNQTQPTGNGSGSVDPLAVGSTYTWSFTYIDGTPTGAGPGMGLDCGVNAGNCPAGAGKGDSRSLIWQIHAQPDTSPCTYLGFSNGPVPGTTRPQQWLVTDCGSSGASQLYRWTGSYTPGETDNWLIQVKVATDATGFIKVWRNNVLVFSDINVQTVHVPTSGSNPPWWNFGPYKWTWSNNPTNSAMTTINATITGMTVKLCPC